MADEVPICDVLCEAMEYLSKLGSNLRARSESLKEKRIRKDKLKNSHAVQKAADKVLLICELSKKSLENVELGVRRVLNLVQDSYQPGHERRASTSIRKTSDDGYKYQYFKHFSHKLKVCKSVPVKHYTSVKVLARSMPMSLHNKYPVYHDCKLYRQRRREEKVRKSLVVIDSDERSNDKTLEQKDNINSLTGNDNSDLSKRTDSMKIDQTIEVLCKENKANEAPTELSEDKDPKCNKTNKDDNVVSQTLDSGSESSNKTIKSNVKKKDGSSYKSKSKNEESTKQFKQQRKRKFKHIQVFDDSSENSNELPTTEELKDNKVVSNDKEAEFQGFSKTESSEQKLVSSNITEKQENKDPKPEDDRKCPENDEEVKPIKSLIKCVSLTKLLKPDVLEKCVELKDISKKTTMSDNSKDDLTSKKRIVSQDKTIIQTAEKSTKNDDDDDDFWTVKRKEVSSFKPKKITVDINRLPKITLNFLKHHSLKKITQDNAIICEINMKDSETDTGLNKENNVPSSSKETNNIKISTTEKIDKVRSALLNDTDSEKSDSNSINLEEIVSKLNSALLDTSFDDINDDINPKTGSEVTSEKNKESEKDTIDEASVENNLLLNDVDNNEQQRNTEKVNLKNALLCESDSDSNTKEKSNESIKQDKNKEKEKNSCELKQSLLNESDSDSNTKEKGNESIKQDKNKEKEKNSCELKQSLLNESDSDSNTKEKGNESIKKDKNKEKENNSCEEKQSLLNESDSESSTKEKDNESIKKDKNKEKEKNSCEVKQSLLNESDSDSNTKEKGNESIKKDKNKEKEKNSCEVKQSLLNETDSDEKNESLQTPTNNNESSNTVDQNNSEEANQINKSLHNESDSVKLKESNAQKPEETCGENAFEDELEVPLSRKRKRKDSNSNTPKKKKHVMESLHAKNMLLHYSSSSDTDDELLRNALQEIKDSLLEEISSDDEKAAKDSGTGKGSGSSESEDGYLNKNKKTKEKESKAQEAEKESKDSEDDVSKKSDEDSEAEISKSCRSKKMGRSRSHPSGSGQNSDSQEAIDKDIDGLTNLNSLMKNRRRRDSSTPEKTDSNSGRKNKKMPKTPLISEDNMLKADSSSEAASEVDSDVGEDLPPVSLPGLNGSGIEHLAKDDLLDESDSSNQSHNEVEEAVKNDSDEDHNPKSKRRKPHAISSDSEAGGSRAKTRDVDARLSDFDESDDDNAATKKSKRKKKVDDSDASAGSSSNDGRKKRRRIKLLNDSDGSGSDTENEGKNKHGRKNIRKVMGKNQLEEATKKAARQEKERIARIADRQKLYNNLEFDESGKPDEVVLEKVVLDFDPETKEPLIEVDRGLVKKLKPHQANGIKFMWDACFESVKRIKKDKGSGCILAHCMGLGKTLQVVSLTHTLLTHSHLTKVNRVLVVCPLSTVLNWVNEFNMWLKHSIKEYDVDIYELSRYKQNSERAYQLSQWFAHGGVCVLGYEMFRNLSADNNKKFKKKMLKHFQEALVDPGPDMVVCDEGHLLKNEKTSLSQSMNRVRSLRRIVLTGTPLQNNLKEYYCMVQFVKPNLLGKYNEYLNRFVNPITNGQYTDSTEHDIRIMKRRSHVLHKMLDGAVQRRDYGVLAPFLPPKHEYVLFITLTEVQIKLYQYYLDNYSRRPLPGKSSGFLFPDFQSLQRIWTHPLVMKYNSERYEIMQQKKRDKEEEEDSEGSLADFIDDDSTPDESTTEESSDDLSDVSDDSRKKSKKKKAKKNKAKESKSTTRRGTRANPAIASQFEQTVELNNTEEPVPEAIEMKEENPTEWWIKLVTEDEIEDMKNSHKLILLFDILRQCDAIGDKLLVFSQSLYSLDLIEHFLGKVDEATQEGRIDDKLAGHVGSWSPGVDYFRLDGSTSCENRSIWCKNFNREDNPRARLFLISTRAGGLGINLVAANRVVIFDVSWNPSHDVQSIFRVYRFGQKKPCYVYRFLAMGTMEEKIYERQVTKQAISKRVIDEQQIDRHYAENDLAELYKFEPRPPVPRPLPPLPKDRLFAEMLREHEAQIYKYHEHDSLLENKEEETLSEEERKAAWEDFENEKNRPPPAPFPTAWPMHNGMMPGLLAQQQQLAYAALAAMLRKDMPNINDNTIRDMLPHLYNANPALMQKLTDMYKYAPPGGMMNPGMMNPVMNAGSGATGNMGGSSGLQYEPPWQRQHQQQQQMRLQQLMQHQNQMGAKYYAGGLGSRDPVAMALQQQRAREMQAGDTRARPRGRPPLQPRAPLAPHADVVNLDSD